MKLSSLKTIKFFLKLAIFVVYILLYGVAYLKFPIPMVILNIILSFLIGAITGIWLSESKNEK